MTGIPQFVLLNVEHVVLGPEWNWKDVSSPFSRVFYVTSGSGKLIFDHCTVDMAPGHAYLIPPQTKHSYACDHCMTMYYLHVYEKITAAPSIFDRFNFPVEITGKSDVFDYTFKELCSDLPKFKLHSRNPSSYDNNPTLARYIKRFESLDLSMKMDITGFLLLMFSEIIRNATPKNWLSDKIFTKILAFINSNLDKELSVTELAKEAGMSVSYFNRRFTSLIGMPPAKYVLHKKIECAQIMLLTESAPIKEIACRTGFPDSSYFTKVFNKITGQNPNSFRKNLTLPINEPS